MLFGKFLSAEEIKSAKDKKKARKKQIFELTQNSIVAKLREDVERLTARATHFENEWFELKKTNEILTGQLQTITGADQELKAELYEIGKEKDAEIEAIRLDRDKLEFQVNDFHDENIALKSKLTTLLNPCSELSSEEVNDQINDF